VQDCRLVPCIAAAVHGHLLVVSWKGSGPCYQPLTTTRCDKESKEV
jgi:hypothetical protein